MIRIITIIPFFIFTGLLSADIPEEIISKINSPDVEERLDACLLLGRMGNPEGIPLLKERLNDPAIIVRHSAANGLARIGGKEVVDIFKDMVSSQSPEKKRIGLAGLAMTGDPACDVEIILRELDNPNWQVRWSSVYVLGEWGYRPALKKLKEIARNDPYFDKATGEYPVRKRAQETCKKILCSIEWFRDLSNARLLAKKLGKPIFTYWFINDNLLCKKMEEEIFYSPELSDISQGFICVKIDVEKSQELTLQYDVNEAPTIIILDKDDNIIDRHIGLISTNELINRLMRVLHNKGTPKEWKERLAKNPNDLQTCWSLAEWYLDNNRIKDAIPLLENIIKNDQKNNIGYTDNAIFVLGYSLGAIGEYKRAIDTLEKLQKEYPNFKDMDKALFCLGLDYLSINKPELAKKVFTELIEAYPESKTVKPAKEILQKL